MSKIKKAFPALPKEFYEVLSERLKANGFDDVKLIKCVDGVIDTCIFPTPTVGHFINYAKENLSCPYNFVFGRDFEKYAGCEECFDYNKKTWYQCKLHKNN